MAKWSKKLLGLAAIGSAAAGLVYYLKKSKKNEDDDFNDDFEDEDFEDEYRIVGPHEADPMNNAISIDSPVGAALIGKRKGDELTIEIPGGLSHLKVLSIERTERT